MKRPRSRSSSDNQTLHPTATLLIDTVIALLETDSMDGVTIAKVLEISGVSHGSLYHHFEDFPDLIEKAVVHRYMRRLEASLAEVAALRTCRDAADFRKKSERVFLTAADPSRRKNRFDRIEVIAAVQGHPRLAESIARAQGDFTDAYAGLLAEFQSNGWMRDDLSASAIAALTQGVILGRVVDDVAERQVPRNAYDEAALAVYRALFFG